MQRKIYDEDHEAFREVVKEFIKRHGDNAARERWDAAGEVDHETMLAAGEAGLIGLSVPEEFGGAGMLNDYRFRAVINEETVKAGLGSLAGAFAIQDDLTVPYIAYFGTEDQKSKWLPKLATGEIIGALAMTEPGAGSDLRGATTTAKKVDGGYIVNGAKTFISSGKTADLVVTFVKTGEGNRPDAFSLLLLEDGMEGFDHSNKLNKMGFHGHDTAELSFSDVFVPEENLIGGEEGHGFIQIMKNLPLERLSIGVASAAAAEAGYMWTVDHTKSRESFGKAIINFQNTYFRLAEMKTTVDALWMYVDRGMELYAEGKLTPEQAAQIKFWASEREWDVLDQGVQLHGGYGYMDEYPITRAFTDARVHRIYGGTNEIMREIVGRDIIKNG